MATLVVDDEIARFSETLRDACARRAPLRIRGGGTRDFYGGALQGDVLEAGAYAGVVEYEPTELVLTARAGTRLDDIEALLRDHGQMLAFEPPRYGAASTLGGCIAAGLSGPRRPYAGSARDHVLGVRLLDGNGTDLRFGGQVMKNVAGYDVSRLMVGALGTLGLLLEVSLKVLPAPASNLTVRQERSHAAAIDLMNGWAGKPYPITATCHTGDTLYVRISGADSAVRAARTRLGGEALAEGDAFWRGIRDHAHAFFRPDEPLWRVTLKPTAPQVSAAAVELVEWSGALRWISGAVDPRELRDSATRAGGHATLFRGGDKSGGVFHPLPGPLMALHRRVKATFDPHGILNPNRMFPGL